MKPGISIEVNDSHVLLPVRPSKNVPRSSRAVFDFLFGCCIDEQPVYQYLLSSGAEEACTVLFYKDQRHVGSLTVSREILSTKSLRSALVLAVGRGRVTHSCVFPIKLLSEPNARDVNKYVVLSLTESLSCSIIKYIAETLLALSGVTSFVFPAVLPTVTAAASGATAAAASSGALVATVAAAGIVIIGIVTSSVLDFLLGTQKTQYRHLFYHWLGTRWLPVNTIGIYEREKRIVKGLVLKEEMNHPKWGFGFIYVCPQREDTGICLSTGVFPQGKETIRKFSILSGLPVRVFNPLDSYEFRDGKQKALSPFPLAVTFIDVRKSWDKALGSGDGLVF